MNDLAGTFWVYFESIGISLLFLFITFIPLEKVFPANPTQRVFRPQWILDFCFMIGQYFLWGGLVLWVMQHYAGEVRSWLPDGWLNEVRQWPVWVQGVVVIVTSDFLIYWGHRLQHNVDFLWRFHKVHHSSKTLDWLAAYREHPLDSIYTIGLINSPAFFLGFDLNAIAAVIAFRGIWAIYIHSNVRMPIGPLKMLIGAPELHHWHHNLERDTGNYANISPLMDLLFGTYVCPDHEPEAFGIKEETPSNYLGQMIEPLLPRQLSQRFSRSDFRISSLIKKPRIL